MLFTPRSAPGVITIPAYREQRRLPGFLAELQAMLSSLPFSIRIQIVDDASPATEREQLMTAIAPQIGTRLGTCSVDAPLALETNTRKGGAILTGWRAHPDAAWFAFVDADGAVPPAEVRRLLETSLHLAARAQPRFAIRKGSDHSVRRDFIRAQAGRLFSRAASGIAGVSFSDVQCGLKFLPADAWNQIDASCLGFGLCFDVELLARLNLAGWPVAAFPIAWTERAGGSVRLWKDGPGMLLTLLRLRRSLRHAPRSETAHAAPPSA